MDRNYYIRIVLDARDNLSKQINDAVNKSNRSFASFGKNMDALNSKMKDLERGADGISKGINRNSSSFYKFVAGVNAARDRTSKLSKELSDAGGRFTRFGFFVRQTIRDVDRFINLRWLLVVSFLVTMGNALVIVGANLLALAASATKAAAALGGALLAGIGQLIPVLVLLQATMLRLDAVMKAVDATEKARTSRTQDQIDSAKQQREAAERLADAQYNLVKANEAVGESEFQLAESRKDLKDALRDQANATRDLARARQRAKDNLVDANLEEADAALSLQEATLAVLDAKTKLREEEQRARLGDQDLEFARAQVRQAQERLKIVTAEGDQAEISGANQALAFAEQNLNSILTTAEKKTNDLKQAQIAVDRAEINKKQARIRDQRATRDARTARGEGVEGSDEVISALKRVEDANRQVVQARRAIINQTRALRDANRNVAVALREVRDAHIDASNAAKKQSSSQQALNDALKDLSPAERGLVQAIDRFKRTARREFGPIQDIIISAFKRAVNAAVELLQDPRIQKAAKSLATSIAGVIDSFTQFSKTTEFRDALVFFTENAARNVPKIGEAFLDLLRIFIRVGRAATPLFNNLIDRIVKLFDRIEKGTRDENRLQRFFKAAGQHLDAWIGLAKAVGNVFGAFVFDTGAADSGLKLLQDITDLLNEWADWIREHPEEINSFFEDMRIKLEALSKVFGKFALLLFDVFRSDEASAFSELVLEVFVPAFGLLVKTLGALAKILLFVFDIPVVGTMAKWILIGGVFYGMLNRLFAITGILGREGFTKLFKSINDNNGAIRRAARGLRDTLIPAVSRAREAMRQGVITASIYAEALKTKLQLAFKSVVANAKTAVTFLANMGKAILAFSRTAALAMLTPPVGIIVLIGAVIAAIILLDRKFHFLRPTLEFILRVFRRVFEWIKDHWKLLAAIIFGPFGLVIIAIVKWRDKILGVFKVIVDFVRSHWKLIVAILLAPFAIGGAIILGLLRWRERIFEFFKAIPGKILGFFATLPANLKKIFDKIPGLLKDALKGLGGIVEDAIRKIPGGGKLLGAFGIGGGGKSDHEKYNEIKREEGIDERDRKKLNAFEKEGLSPAEAIVRLLNSGSISKELAGKLAKKYVFAAGGTVPGGQGQAVPVVAHAGEWILNRQQQNRLAQRIGGTVQDVENWIFNRGGQKKEEPKVRRYRDFDLRPQTDPDGNVVWFIMQDDGTFGQVSERDAQKIIASNGVYIPAAVRRSTHGFSNPVITLRERNREIAKHKYGRGGVVQAFAAGGVVRAPTYSMGSMRHYAEGGVVLNTPMAGGGNPPAPRIGTFTQHFEVNAEGSQDWNYIQRLSAIHAQTSF